MSKAVGENTDNLVDLLESRADEQPDKTVYIFLPDGEGAEIRLTYERLRQNAKRMAKHLRARQVPIDSPVLLLFQPGIDYICAFYGCLYAGAIPVPAYPPTHARQLARLQSIIDDADTDYALTTRAELDGFQSIAKHASGLSIKHWLVMDDMDAVQTDWEDPCLDGERIAFLQYTSGSTSAPKGVMVTHRNVLANIALTARATAATSRDVMVFWLPPYHDFGLIGGILAPLIVDCSCVLMRPVSFLSNPYRWLKVIAAYRATITGAPNFAYDLCARVISGEQRASVDLSSLRVAFNGAEPVRVSTMDKFSHAFEASGFRRTAWLAAYGLAEATLMVSGRWGGVSHTGPGHKVLNRVALQENRVVFANDFDTDGVRLASTGTVLDDHRVVIVHPQTLQRCPDDEIGEIWVAGPCVAKGYWRREVESAAAFPKGFDGLGGAPCMRTGDLGFLHEGELYVCGRRKDLIIVNGLNIYPQDVELAAGESHAALRENGTIAFALEHTDTEQLVIVQELDFRQRADGALFGRIASAVADAIGVSPDIILLVKAGRLPRTSSGKVRRQQCKKDFIDGQLDVVSRWDRDKAVETTPVNYVPSSTDAPVSTSATAIEWWLRTQLAHRLGLDAHAIESEQSFADFGLTSMASVQLSEALAAWLGRPLAPTVFWDYPSIAKLAGFLAGDIARRDGTVAAPWQPPQRVGGAEPIAIVGLSCRFPGAESVQAFWDLLSSGGEAIRTVPEQRYKAGTFEDCDHIPSHTRRAGFLEQVDLFDAHFFGISPPEAERMDPQQRLVLEAAWQALEDAGIAAPQLSRSATGVFVGLSTHDYDKFQHWAADGLNVYSVTGSAGSIAANRLSYTFDLRGPSVTIDTACSSSLVAIHMACQSLRTGESTLALAGGVNLILSAESSAPFARAGMLSPDGRCKAFDAGADGYVRGEGCGMLVLKTLSDARRDGDPVHALILGSAVSQDGRSNGLIAPNGNAQADVIRQALDQAKVVPEQISYIEAHGTGTALGDPIELNALLSVFPSTPPGHAPRFVGSVKTNIGHLEAAAGVAGLIKVVLALENQVIPAHLHYRTPNPHSTLSDGLAVPARQQSWMASDERRYAGISSFGFGGTIAHMIIADTPAVQEEARPERPWHIVTLSAKTLPALDALSEVLGAHLQASRELSLLDVVYTHQLGRQALPMRRMFVCRNRDEAIDLLSASSSATLPTAKTGSRVDRLVLLFPGQGTQTLRMAQDLYRHIRQFRSVVDECAAILNKEAGFDLSELLYPSADLERGSLARLERTEFAQPALFAIEYAMARTWMTWGVAPSAMIGHSLGEYVAACLAGVFSLKDALSLVAARGRLMQAMPAGAMLSVALDEAQLAEHLDASVSLAAVNGPQRCVVAGAPAEIAAFQQRLERLDISCRRLATSHAFHSHMMEPAVEAFAARVAAIDRHEPAIPFISNVTGTWITAAQATDPAYWATHLRAPVRFAAGLRTLGAEPDGHTLIEAGPGQTLCGFARLHPDTTSDRTWSVMPSLSRDPTRDEDLAVLFDTVGRLWLAGFPIDWEAFHAGESPKRVRLPTYPFQRERYWLERPLSGSRPADAPNDRAGVTLSTESTSNEANEMSSSALPTRDRAEALQTALRDMVARLLRMDAERIDPEAPLLELGADSLVVVQAIKTIEKTYGITISIRQIFEELTTIAAIAHHLDSLLPSEDAVVSVSKPSVAQAISGPDNNKLLSGQPATPVFQVADGAGDALNPGDVSAMERLMRQQLDAFSRMTTQQLAVLRGEGVSSTPNLGNRVDTTPGRSTAAVIAKTVAKPFVPYQSVSATTKADPYQALTPRQRRYMKDFVSRYTERTRKSRELTQRYRPVLADNRASAGFRFSIKELLYPIISERSDGPRIWDVDGNEYIDLTMGFGVNLFGHRPQFIQTALIEQLDAGLALGPQTKMAGEVAELVSTLTGMERVAFCNSGTEAVMLALRLARTVTGRNKIAIFAGSFHGWSDDTLMEAETDGGRLSTVAMAPGLQLGTAANTLVLDYGSTRSLEIIRAHAHELAAVLVEPIQSRRPDWQPREFLQELRGITAKQGTALIFDEMITGFRLHPGGAQAWYDVRADIATYGKVLGAGMPVGMVAGAAAYLDAVDGGQWTYGDMSYPRETTTFFAGTFCKHPMMLAAAKALLQKLIDDGPALQQRLNARTDHLVRQLNDVFTDGQVPVEVVHCGSLLRFNTTQNVDLLFYHLMDGGLYIWEGRNMFLSTAHSDDDIARIVEIVKASVRAMRDGGFLPEPPTGSRNTAANVTVDTDATARSREVTAAASAVPAAASRRSDHTRAVTVPVRPGTKTPPVKFSLSFFGHYDADYDESKYRLLFESARFGDSHGFEALWLPERHFHAFGGLSPNPAVLAASLARETTRIQLRAGSVVLPLHHPVRIAEEWSMVDNLSDGRVGVACASGWHPNDFVFAPDAYGNHRELMFDRIEQVRTLWQGRPLRVRDGSQKEIDVKLFPMPRQRELPIWITIVGNPDTYRRAGEIGAGILTNLMGQTVDELARNIRIYREALDIHGHDAAKHRVTVLMHTFVRADEQEAHAQARAPFIRYLQSSIGLFQNMVKSLGINVDVQALSEADRDYLLASAYERYVQTSALIGNAQSCRTIVDRLREIGVDEIGCFIDFGVDANVVVDQLVHLNELKDLSDASEPPPDSTDAELTSTTVQAPLTVAQKGIWFECQLHDEAALGYKSTTVLRLHGELDVEALKAAFQCVVDRHSSLRTVFEPTGEFQRALPPMPFHLPVIDFTDLTDPMAAVDEWLSRNNHNAVDFNGAVLFHVHVFRVGNGEHVLAITSHHLIVDGLSQELLLQELAASYSAIRAGGKPRLPQALPFDVYAARQHAYLQSERFELDEAYWLRQFSRPLPPVLQLPGARKRNTPAGYRARRHTATIPEELYARLTSLARENGSTLFMTLLAVTAVLLHRMSGQDELVIGIPVSSGREETGDANLLGYTMNLVPIWCRSTGNPRFVEYLAGIRAGMLDAYAHFDYPFGHLLRQLNVPQEAYRRPIAPILFNLNRSLELPSFQGLTGTLESSPVDFGADELFIDILQLPDRLSVTFQYREDLLEGEAVVRMMENMLRLLSGIVENPDGRVDQLPLLTEAECNQLAEWNQTSSPYDPTATVHVLFEQQVDRAPDATALMCEGKALSYAELNAKVNQVAHYLRTQGIGPDVLVGIHAERSLELIVGLLAVLKAGGAYVPLDPAYPQERIAYMLDDARPAILLTQTHLLEHLPQTDIATICLDGQTDVFAGFDLANPTRIVEPAHLAYVIYTSGSTGKPKGVAVPHDGWINFNHAMWTKIGLTASDVLLSVTSPSFDIAALEFFLPLLTGGTTVLCSRETVADPIALAQLAEQSAVTVMQATPSTWRMLIDQAWPNLTADLIVLCGGEALGAGMARDLLNRSSAVWNLYGPTETTIWSTSHRITHPETSVPIGRPILNTQTYILDAALTPVPVGVVGELYIGGAGVVRGYLRRPDLTAERFLPNPFGVPGSRMYKTGDMVRYLPDGAIEYLGRQDDQLKIRGFRIELAEIEAALTAQLSVSQAVVTAHRGDFADYQLVAYVVRNKASDELDLAVLRRSLRDLLPYYMMPSFFMEIESIPLLPNGKIDRKSLPPPDFVRGENGYAAPKTPTEVALSEIWTTVLKLDRIGVHDNFLDLGGQSVMATQMMSQIRSHFEIDLPLRVLFEAPTLAALAERVDTEVQSLEEISV